MLSVYLVLSSVLLSVGLCAREIVKAAGKYIEKVGESIQRATKQSVAQY